MADKERHHLGGSCPAAGGRGSPGGGGGPGHALAAGQLRTSSPPPLVAAPAAACAGRRAEGCATGRGAASGAWWRGAAGSGCAGRPGEASGCASRPCWRELRARGGARVGRRLSTCCGAGALGRLAAGPSQGAGAGRQAGCWAAASAGGLWVLLRCTRPAAAGCGAILPACLPAAHSLSGSSRISARPFCRLAAPSRPLALRALTAASFVLAASRCMPPTAHGARGAGQALTAARRRPWPPLLG